MTGRRGILVAWCGSLLVAAFGLHALGGGALAAPPLDPMSAGEWLSERDPLVATFAVLRVLVLVVCWYLLLVTVAGIVIRWLRADHLTVVLDRLTVPLVRRLVQQAAGLSMATVLVAAPTSALATTASVTVGSLPVVDAPAMPLGLLPTQQDLAPGEAGSDDRPLLKWQIPPEGGGAHLVDGGGVLPPAPAAPTERTGSAPDVVGVHVVRSGDSLWRIASEHLAATVGHAPGDEEVVPFWQRVIELNRDRLVDPTDPDLILPGQELLIPPVVVP